MADVITISITATAARFAASLHRFRAVTDREATDAVRVTALNALGIARHGTPVDTGTLKKAWHGPRQAGKYTYTFGNNTPYAATVEYGLYRRIGPRTTQGGGVDLGEGFVIGTGIFSKQAPVGMMRKALATAKPGLYQRLITSHQRHWGQ